jgi:hypothetical protein
MVTLEYLKTWQPAESVKFAGKSVPPAIRAKLTTRLIMPDQSE